MYAGLPPGAGVILMTEDGRPTLRDETSVSFESDAGIFVRPCPGHYEA
jgi:hypothetical protein